MICPRGTNTSLLIYHIDRLSVKEGADILLCAVENRRIVLIA